MPDRAWAYFDTSALVKRYVEEPHSRDVLSVMDRHDCVTSAVLPVELRSALRRRLADGTLRTDRVADVLKRFAADREFWALMEVTRDVLARAETLVTTHPLRALDAIHVASAQLFKTRLGIFELRFVSADMRQTEAAAAAGMTTHYVGT